MQDDIWIGVKSCSGPSFQSKKRRKEKKKTQESQMVFSGSPIPTVPVAQALTIFSTSRAEKAEF